MTPDLEAQAMTATAGAPARITAPSAVQPQDTALSLAPSALGTPIASLPFTIDEPGHYYLIKTLAGVSGQHGIVIQAADVSLDLAGFSLTGVSGSLNGVRIELSVQNVSISNGIIRDWGGNGIASNFDYQAKVKLWNLRCVSNAGSGVGVGYVVAQSCEFSGNGAVGLTCNQEALLTDCYSADNGSHGLITGARSVVRGCIIRGNAGDGLRVGRGSVVGTCQSSGNAGDGVEVTNSGFAEDGTVITDCVSSNNADSGLRGAANTQVESCGFHNNNLMGLSLQSGSSARRCAANSNDEGIVVTGFVTVQDCVANGNATGIKAGPFAGIVGCQAMGNTSTGILMDSDSSVTSCNVASNDIFSGFGGIRVTGTRNTIERNSLFNDDLIVSGGSNVIVGNRLTGPGSLQVTSTANTIFGNVLNNPTAAFSVVAGNDTAPTGTTATATNPWLNVLY